jgi:dephospho-CoA kinase
MVVGVTGGYCSGKTLACSIFKELGFAHIDVDQIGHEVLEEMKGKVVREFGRTVLTEGRIDRRALGAVVFGDPEKKRMLEAILHPTMVRRVKQKVREQQNAVVSAALLVEMHLYRLCDFVIAIQIDEELAIRRGMERDGLSRGEAKARIGAQIPLKEKLQYVDKVIDNSGTDSEFRMRVRRTAECLAEKG